MSARGEQAGFTPLWRSAEHGFTLIEMLVTLAIAALVAGVGFPALERQAASWRTRAAAQDCAALLAQARYGAVRQDRSIAVRADGGGRLSAPALNMVTTVSRPASLTMEPAQIVFHPDGTASGGSLTVAAGALSRRFTIDSRTGQISAQ